jgi:hypothetical protein
MEHLLRSHLKGAFDRACVSVRSQGNQAEVKFSDNLRRCLPLSVTGTVRSWLSGSAQLAQ